MNFCKKLNYIICEVWSCFVEQIAARISSKDCGRHLSGVTGAFCSWIDFSSAPTGRLQERWPYIETPHHNECNWYCKGDKKFDSFARPPMTRVPLVYHSNDIWLCSLLLLNTSSILLLILSYWRKVYSTSCEVMILFQSENIFFCPSFWSNRSLLSHRNSNFQDLLDAFRLSLTFYKRSKA